MKNLIATVLLMGCTSMFGQSVLFHENFDSPSGPDSVSASIVIAGNNPTLWNDTNFVFSSVGNSYHLKGSQNNSAVSFETPAFSTIGQKHVYLNFNQIAKIWITNRVEIEVSTDNGTTWSTLSGANGYYGQSLNFSSLGFFNSVSYPTIWGSSLSHFSGPTSIPNNQWWQHEIFDISSLTLHPVTGQGYSQVKVRFKGTFQSYIPNMPFTYASGWYVDDIEVIGTQCEIFKPTIKVATSGTVIPQCNNKIMHGGFVNPTLISQQKVWEVNDNIAIASVKLEQIKNGVVQPNIPLSKIGSTQYYSYTFANYTPSDTVQWRIEALDTCGNAAYFPDTGFYKFYFIPHNTKCITGNCNSEHAYIKKFPWSQNFESSAWEVGFGSSGLNVRGSIPESQGYEAIPADSISYYGWSVRRYATPSTNTGPSEDHTTGYGKYLYSEFQGQSGGNNTIFILPCIDLRNNTQNLNLSYYYHMFGADISRLNVHIDSTSSTSANWHLAKSIQNEQQLSSTEPWQKATINLGVYTGKIIKIRFVAISNASTFQRANIAIDDLKISENPAVDIEVNSIVTPTNLACLGTTNIPVEVQITNLSSDSLYKIPLAYQLDNNAVEYDTLFLTDAATGVSHNFTFSQLLTYTTSASHTLKVWSTVALDTTKSNDTVQMSLLDNNFEAITSFPHVLNFENSTYAGSGIGSLNSSNWILNPDGNSTEKWRIGKAPFTNNNIGPMNVAGKNQQCLIYQSQYSSHSNYATIQSQCIDLNNLTNPVLNFLYHKNNAYDFSILVKEVGTSSWVDITPTLSDVLPKEHMHGAVVPLGAYVGKMIQISIRARNTLNAPSNFIAIDNVVIREQPSIDLELRKLSFQTTQAGVNTIPSISIFYNDWNHQVSQSYSKRLNVALHDKCDPSAPIIYGWSDVDTNPLPTASVNGQFTYNNLVFQSPVPAGNYRARFWIGAVGDQGPFNDTLYVDFSCSELRSLPIHEDFESCDDYLNSYGKMRQWEIGSPTKTQIDSAYGGDYCMVTNADTNSLLVGSYNIFELEPFTGLDSLYGVKLSFWQNFDFGSTNSGYGVVQLFDGQNWINLTNLHQGGTNWNNFISSTTDPTLNYGFVGSSHGWTHSSVPLPHTNNGGPYILRFLTTANNVEGWAIDDLEISIAPQHSSRPNSAKFNSGLPKSGYNSLFVNITNSGAHPLTTFNVHAESNGINLITESVTLPTPLQAGKSTNVALTQALLLDTTLQDLLIYTSLPNNNTDAKPLDDSLYIKLYFMTSVNNLPSCIDLETSPYFVPIDIATNTIDTSWINGSPGKSVISTAKSGQNAWFTGTNHYAKLLNSYLYSPIYSIKGGLCYRLSFWHQYETEYSFDGGLVEFTLDSGSTWQTLGSYWSTDSLWYNTPAIQSLDAFKPGWSGISNGWVKAEKSLQVFWDGKVQFRFRFASNASMSGEGWAIDDICMELINSGCQTIGQIEPVTIKKDISVYPSPASNHIMVKLPYESSKKSWTCIIYNLQGQAILTKQFSQNDSEVYKINVAHLPTGLYNIKLSNNQGIEQIERFVKK
ncbi:T9SS type A sorting domain-containing protein [Owenweeksia hongkongensis]|uniref:T9SS type A sorting domain-containing protein n=1 Tax=Owenweeksia hongkongensis TaxID=253245 RepID=UPI003A8CF350